MSMPYTVVPILAALVLAVACSDPEAPSKARHTPPAVGTVQPVVSGVKIATVKLETLQETLAAVGTVRSRTQSVVSSRLLARVVAVHVHTGDRVKAAQVLIELDDSDLKTQMQKAAAGVREAQEVLAEVEQAIQGAVQAVAAAQAHEEIAQTTRRRYEALLERHSVAPQEYDEIAARQKAAAAELARARAQHAALLAKKQQVLARIEQAKAEVANTQVSLGYTRLTAPLTGLITAKSVEIGNLASPGVPLCTIAEEHYRLEASVPETAGNNIRLGQQATVHIDALGQSVPAPVVEIVPAAEPLSRTITVRLDLPATTGLQSGFYGRAHFRAGQRQALLVPQQAVVERGQLQGVFVVEANHTVQLRLVKTGQADAGRVEILSGLHAGERLIVEGVEHVSDGSRVEGEG